MAEQDSRHHYEEAVRACTVASARLDQQPLSPELEATLRAILYALEHIAMGLACEPRRSPQ